MFCWSGLLLTAPTRAKPTKMTLVQINEYDESAFWHQKTNDLDRELLICKNRGCTGTARSGAGHGRIIDKHTCGNKVSFGITCLGIAQSRISVSGYPEYFRQLSPMTIEQKSLIVPAFYVDSGKYVVTACLTTGRTLSYDAIYNIEFHGTDPLAIDGIIAEGFRYEGVNARNGRMHGEGIYTTPHAKNACEYVRDYLGLPLRSERDGVLVVTATEHRIYEGHEMTKIRGKSHLSKVATKGNLRFATALAAVDRVLPVEMDQTVWHIASLVHIVGLLIVRKT